MSRLRLAYYGDDFTGSTDVLEALTLNGLRAVLFLDPPCPEHLARRFPGTEAVGLAGLSRALPPEEMDRALRPALSALAALQPELIHYKICSTFDSSPTLGSIGQAIRTAAEVLGARRVPVAVGAPRLRRYVVFGQLFATVGRDTYRLDRHPTMARHPVTPMGEADLRRHLAAQLDWPADLVDVLALEAPEAAWQARRAEVRAAPEPRVVFFDTLAPAHLARVGAALWEDRAHWGRFVVGSSGVEWALAAHWAQTATAADPVAPLADESRARADTGESPAPPAGPGPVDQLLVLSGSASPVTAEQIRRAAAAGYATRPVPLSDLLDPATAPAAGARLRADALADLRAGRSLVLYSTLGPEDPALARTAEAAARHGWPDPGPAVGDVLARLAADLRAAHPLRRICIAGGDTSGRAARALGIEALTLAMPLAPGAPLCRAHGAEAGPAWEIVLKGGQNGGPDFLESVRLARPEIYPT